MALDIFSSGYKLLYFLAIFLSHNVHVSDSLFGNKLLVVLYDGFRWDYASLTDTPNLDRIASLGATAHHMNPVFPPQSGPAMYSIATGQYPENHGIIGDILYDPSILKNVTIDILHHNNLEIKAKLYKGTEPIWVTAGNAGLKTACFDLPGCDTDISGYRVDFPDPHHEDISPRNQIDLAMKWFTQDDVSLIILHYNEPDLTGHMTGPAPESQETLAMIRQMDDVTGYMLDQLDKHGILEEVNVLMMSDHGITSVSTEDRYIPLYEFLDPSDVELLVQGGPHMSILPVEGKLEKVYDDIKGKHPNISVYLKEEIPERFHYSRHDRVLPILVLADEGWLIYKNASDQKRTLKAAHGYDNELMSMKAFFYAMGPDILPQVQIQEFSQVDLCPLMCKLLQLTPSHQGNGSFAVFEKMMRKDPIDMRGWLILMTSLGIVALAILISAVIVICRKHIGDAVETKRLDEEDERRYLYHKLEDT